MKPILFAIPMLFAVACGSNASSTAEPDMAEPSTDDPSTSTEPSGDDPVASPEPAAGGNAACSLPFEAGPCEAAMPVWYFDSSTGQCQEETYGGCEGNDNNFASRDECVAACGGD